VISTCSIRPVASTPCSMSTAGFSEAAVEAAVAYPDVQLRSRSAILRDLRGHCVPATSTLPTVRESLIHFGGQQSPGYTSRPAACKQFQLAGIDHLSNHFPTKAL
jgi:hypothetical protein